MEGAGVAQLIDEEEFPQGAGIELFAAFCKTDFTKSSKYCYITKQAMSGMNNCLQTFSESDGTHHDTPVNHGTMPYRKKKMRVISLKNAIKIGAVYRYVSVSGQN